jgi:hypothetical protein
MGYRASFRVTAKWVFRRLLLNYTRSTTTGRGSQLESFLDVGGKNGGALLLI